jgi:iron complex transport system substrate-binding protein
VEVFPIGDDFEDVRASVRRMGALLGTEARAEALIGRMDADLAAPEPALRPRAAIYYSNGYTSGAESLADAVLQAAGYDNIAAETGQEGLAKLPLESLVLADPDLLVTGQDYDSPARAQEILAHPALRDIRRTQANVAGRLWVCATPHAAEAVVRLRETRLP